MVYNIYSIYIQVVYNLALDGINIMGISIIYIVAGDSRRESGAGRFRTVLSHRGGFP